MKLRKIIGVPLTIAALFTGLCAQKEDHAATQANNPLANLTVFNLHDYYMGDLSGTDKTANQFWFRYAKPFSIGETNWIMRASLPINTFPTFPNGDKKTGVGDLNIVAAYLIDTGKPGVSFGIGPQITMPIASNDALGSEKWSAGLANVLFNATSRKFQYGYLLTWQGSFAGDDDRSDVNVGAFQPFAFLQLGQGNYLRAAPIWIYNFKNNDYNVPLGIGMGKVIKKDKVVYNIFIEPQFSVAHEGDRQTLWQVFVGLNMQFK